MSQRTATKHLKSLADTRQQIAELQEKREQQLADVLTAEQIQENIEIEMAFTQKLQPLQDKESELTAKVKTAVLKLKQTVKGDGLMAVFSKAKAKWNTDKLEGYAVDHKGILQFKEVGKPSISIRKS